MSKLVLIVDDDRRSARILARLFRDDGFDVELAFDGATAVGRLSRDPLPRVLITDLRMPHVDGLAVARYARSRRHDMQVIYTTSYPEMLSGREELDGEVVHAKPVDYRHLRAQVDTALTSTA